MRNLSSLDLNLRDNNKSTMMVLFMLRFACLISGTPFIATFGTTQDQVSQKW